MTKPSRATKSRVAQFVSRRLYELKGRKSQADIARLAGFASPGMVSMISAGRARLPIERAAALARALEVDPKLLVRLTLEESLSGELLEEIYGTSISPATAPSIATLESHPLFRGALSSPSQYHASMLALSVQVRLALHEAGRAQQFLAHVAARNERVRDRLGAIGSELETMLGRTSS